MDQKEEITSGAECSGGRMDGRVDGTHTGDVPTTELGQRSEATEEGCAFAVTKLNGVVEIK